METKLSEVKTTETQSTDVSSAQSLIDRIIDEASNRQQTPLIPNDHEWKVYETMSAMSAGTPFYTKLGGKNGIMAIMLYAREINMPPMTALNGGIDFVMGRLSITARTANERIRQAGHLVRIISIDQNGCSIYGKRKDTDEEHTSIFTVEDARRAQLVKKDSNWEKYPGDMCFARAITRLARRLFPDVIGGASIEGEASENEEIQPEQTSAPQEHKPSTIVGMAHEASGATKPEKSKRKNSQSIDLPSAPSQQPLIDVSAQDQAEQLQQAEQGPPEVPENGKNGNDEKTRSNGRKLIVDKLSAHFGGDVARIDNFLLGSLPGFELKPCMDNLAEFSAAHLRDIYAKVKALTA